MSKLLVAYYAFVHNLRVVYTVYFLVQNVVGDKRQHKRCVTYAEHRNDYVTDNVYHRVVEEKRHCLRQNRHCDKTDDGQKSF